MKAVLNDITMQWGKRHQQENIQIDTKYNIHNKKQTRHSQYLQQLLKCENPIIARDVLVYWGQIETLDAQRKEM